jgi:serine/threonine protein kinase
MIRPPDHSDPLVGQVLPTGLLVLERLGSPSEEALYRARYSPTGPPVALMFLRLPRNPRDPSSVFPPSPRFWQQLRRACQIRHPNVASLLEVGESPDGRAYAAGEFLTGQVLSEMVSSQGPLPPAQAVDVCLQAAAGLQAAHRLGVAHGALSPHTILVTPAEDDRPLVKLIGFDFSWYQSDSGGSLDHGGDDRYSSPERLAGSAPDELSDVFSLGAVLHYLLAGTPPGDGSGPDSIPQALQQVVDRALASPDRRYPTAAAFADAISQAAKSPTQRPRPEQRRWLAASLVLVLVAAGLWLGWNRFAAKPGDTPHRVELGARIRQPEVVVRPQQQQPWPSKNIFASLVNRILGPRSVETGAISSSKSAGSTPPASSPRAEPQASPPRAEPRASPPSSERRDSVAGPFVSPFRRSHPWAAHPNGRTYFSSSCAIALASPELIYFVSEQEARATGRSRCTAPECS